jgi:hypothetical protein
MHYMYFYPLFMVAFTSLLQLEHCISFIIFLSLLKRLLILANIFAVHFSVVLGRTAFSSVFIWFLSSTRFYGNNMLYCFWVYMECG